ncbi:MAG TPA: biotin carboxylase N-terminal domain-containing protein [Deltaproteobacteria bacterium]|nr:biotin carboxylase N-terminal domain-containing protein [Deltaproteobacteria bacterium]HPR55175.1 biotin carboxylase N-terminal domain-containing protein [Deltaproteobacteria bacterium]HXK47952.1 biotin carboxylase N-terminal domain-containing protein [Deltaproteobacteria bacterium]
MKKLLVANRGEIVLRVFKAAKELGLKTVAVYSDADENAPHVREADEAYNIGKAPPPMSYLNIGNLIEAVKKSGADAVHPGYGFLSENAEFARAVVDNGTTWVGPSPEVLHNIESKSYCRQLGQKLGVPITPGTVGSIESADVIMRLFKELGPPLLVKLDKGGGGKGIQPIYTEDQIVAIFESSQSIGKMAFGSPDCYIEKRIINPRHIEVQCLGDNHGNFIALGERECSVQRKYQKVVEEGPSPVVSPSEREKLQTWAVTILREMGYNNAGTVEFLRASDGNFYFMEVNARIQVEHPVTEMITGVDLVKSQLKIAMGEKLDMSQDDVSIKGSAIEMRIYAEDPLTFMPSPGIISSIDFPELSGNVRLDHALEVGFKVSPFYDPMLAKLIVYATSRHKAIEQMKRSLTQFHIEGVKTTIPLGLLIMESDAFEDGYFHTDTLASVLQASQATS